MSFCKPETNQSTGVGLADKIARFSRLLRDHGIAASLPTVLDSIRGLPLIDIGSLDQFKCLLKTNMICRKEDLSLFNELFIEFWLDKYENRLFRSAGKKDRRHIDDVPQSPGIRFQSRCQAHGEEQNTAAGQPKSIRYSPFPLNKVVADGKISFTESRQVYETIQRILRPLNNRLSRRHHYTVRGKQIALRKILRKNMQFGGELIFLDFKKKKSKKRRIVFLCDISGSMDTYTLLILQFIHALMRIDRRTEIFFSQPT